MTDDPIHRGAEPESLHQARRCGARTRTGRPCRSPAVRGRPRCRMHGCGKGAGGPEGERNGNYRHGRHTKERRRELRALRALVQEVKDLTQTLRGSVRSAKQRKATEQ
jgi:glucans biosynthesis protein